MGQEITEPPSPTAPVRRRVRFSKRIGWHTSRRSLASLLVGVNAPVKIKREIMRHGNARITLEFYAQSTMPAKQQLQAQGASEWTPNRNGGDDGTRTRGLCRDSERLTSIYNNIGSTDGDRKHWKYTVIREVVYHDVYRDVSASEECTMRLNFEIEKLISDGMQPNARFALTPSAKKSSATSSASGVPPQLQSSTS